ncbi:MAG: hypothetical protein E7597_06520 [Ruminococcaceae bacterium]|nr:hypothetical protein [Oscillospiraceae bacterium]
MARSEKNREDAFVVDIAHIAKSVWQRAWIIALAGILAAALAFGYSAFIITPTYSSSIMLYINNSSIAVGDMSFSISSSEISAAQSLVKTYSVILKNRTTLEQVAEDSGLSYSWDELNAMISAAPVQDTEIMGVTVTCTDAYDAEKIANSISRVLPRRISGIIEGSSMEVVDNAVVNTQKVAPSISKYTATGLILGVLLALIWLVIKALKDNTIHDEDYILNNYDYPILAKVPDLLDVGAKKYSYYRSGTAATKQAGDK